jgi:hypothetical protein
MTKDPGFAPVPAPMAPAWGPEAAPTPAAPAPIAPTPAAPTAIACSLDAWALGSRAEEWRSLVAWSVTSVEVDGRAVRLVLRDSEADLTAAVALAQREKECCPFFDVSVTIEADVRTLVLAVPEGAEDMLAAFVDLLA